ncbi:MAG TPA: hypothetical protein VNR38_13340 [Ureibacillus sp.]|nr:hypothetical protein [Ureibacillus sp.]
MQTAISNETIEKSFQDQLKQLESNILRLEEQYKLFDEEREIRKHIFLQNSDITEYIFWYFLYLTKNTKVEPG